jgi:YggT family protein
MAIICLGLQIYGLAVLLWVILSWVQISSMHPLAKVTTFLDRIIYPLILPLRRVIPPLRIGSGMLDLSPLVLLLGLGLLRGIVCR